MKLVMFFVGKTTDSYLKEGIDVFLKRIPFYLPVEVKIIAASAQKERERAMKDEFNSIHEKLLPNDFVVVLDENGKEMTSRQLASQFEKWMNQGISRIAFIIGGAYGTAEELRKRANLVLSVSKFTFTHQMVRLILVEQVYRALTITRNESYHHD